MTAAACREQGTAGAGPTGRELPALAGGNSPRVLDTHPAGTAVFTDDDPAAFEQVDHGRDGLAAVAGA